jgi:hypothetical protein
MPDINISPIPWTVSANDDWVRVCSGTMDVCIVSSFGARLANARLIATAPLLYEALHQMLYSKKPLSETIEYAQTVLHLARGAQ